MSNQLFKMELFAKIVKGFQAIGILAKISILDVDGDNNNNNNKNNNNNNNDIVYLILLYSVII